MTATGATTTSSIVDVCFRAAAKFASMADMRREAVMPVEARSAVRRVQLECRALACVATLLVVMLVAVFALTLFLLVLFGVMAWRART